VVTAARGIRSKRISEGQRDLDEIEAAPPTGKPREQRIRRPGAGRKPLTEKDPKLREHLESLLDPVTRGDPESPVRWTSNSTEKLAAELKAMGHSVSPRTVSSLLHDLDYSLQANRKTTEGNQHADRNAQFEHINAQAEAFQERGQPVIAVDTKKKELVGDFKNGGRDWQPKGQPVPVRVHDFVDKMLGKAIPYGVYDIGRNDAMTPG
jgi:transposase